MSGVGSLQPECTEAEEEEETAYTIYQNTRDGLQPRLNRATIRALPRSVRWILMQPHIEQGERDWLFVRKFAITASNCCEALHCSEMRYLRTARALERYEVAEKLLDEKAALTEPFEGNAATQHGTLYEPVAVRSFAARHQTDLFLVGLLMHPRHRWLGASPDAVCLDGRLVEIKVPKSRSFKVGDPVLRQYWVQCQIQAEVTGSKYVTYSEYRVPSTSKRARIKEPRINDVVVKRDKEWFSKAQPLLANFVETMYRLRMLSDLYDSQWLQRERQLAQQVPPASSRTSPLSTVADNEHA